MNRSYNKIRHIQETNQRLEKRVIKEQGLAGNASTGQAKPAVNQRVLALANYLKQYSFTPAEIQQAQSALKAPVKPVAPKPAAPAPIPDMNLIGM
jgi:hypothetical protein